MTSFYVISHTIYAVWVLFYSFGYFEGLTAAAEAYLELSRIFKMEIFVEIVNDFYQLNTPLFNNKRRLHHAVFLK